MHKFLSPAFILLILCLVLGCKPNITPEVSTRSGDANFSKFIAIGNSLTSGYADGGLYLSGQQVAFPNLMAEHMQALGGGTFTTPYFSLAQANGSGYLKLKDLINNLPVLEEMKTDLAYRDAQGHLTKFETEIENLGIPGMRLDLCDWPAFSLLNPYFERLVPAAEAGKITYSDFVKGRNHTFFSLWLGNNDALGYALNGGIQSNLLNILTDKQKFDELYGKMVLSLTSNNQRGVVGTIPDVSAAAFFTTVSVKGLLESAKALNPAAAYIFIETGSGAVRVATNEDLVLLTFQTANLFAKPNAKGAPYGLSPQNPIENKWILDKDEVAVLRDYTASYNQSIKSWAAKRNLAIADAHAFLNMIKNGYMVNGLEVNSAFITGGIFSLDGIHLTPRGNALAANLFIDAINVKYGSNLSRVNVSRYPGIRWP